MQEAKKLNEIIFLVEETDDGYVAQALGHSIFTQADSIEELREMVKDAVECHFDEEERPRIIRLHIVRQEVLTV
jgi:predicted RNase H-like HicB family nuclease